MATRAPMCMSCCLALALLFMSPRLLSSVLTFGLPKHAIPPLLLSLHLHAVKFDTAILSTRRELERDPGQVCVIPPPRTLLQAVPAAKWAGCKICGFGASEPSHPRVLLILKSLKRCVIATHRKLSTGCQFIKNGAEIALQTRTTWPYKVLDFSY